MDSIIQSEKECYVCASRLVPVDYSKCSRYANLECHHIIHGTANRKLSEKHGLKVWLCQEHHRGNTGVHNNHILDELLKEIAQKEFEKTHLRNEFRSTFGKSYL